jgi:DNA-3-methyladenine glycosylase
LTATAVAGARLGREFFARAPSEVARGLIGCSLVRDGVGGVIVETEAYAGNEPACHAFVGRTARTEVLFGAPGHAYVYLSYGIHHLFNVVTGEEGDAGAVLIRALEPRWGLDRMRSRRPGRPDPELCSGPGRLSLALGIGPADNRRDVCSGPIALHSPESAAADPVAGPRIGISKATELPWRFCATGSPWVSRAAG